MKLYDLYKRRVDRRIDPVATVSELDEGYVQKEIEEYFFTDTLYDHLHTFLGKLTQGTKGRTGVWINGYYGSGKSHFLKYIYYCLSEDFGEQALGHFRESLSADYEDNPIDQLTGDGVTEGDVQDIQGDLEDLTVAPIMFNIKTVADDDVDERSVTRVFYNRLNAFRGYNKSNLQIARFEKMLDQQGRLGAFKEAFEQRTGDAWMEKASQSVAFNLDKVLDAADAVADLDTSSARATLEAQPSVSTEELIDEMEAFLREKPDDYRLVYLVDEVSQYTEGKPDLLLDLQTIVEQVGDRLGNRVWIACTAQQALDRLVDNAREHQQADYSFGWGGLRPTSPWRARVPTRSPGSGCWPRTVRKKVSTFATTSTSMRPPSATNFSGSRVSSIRATEAKRSLWITTPLSLTSLSSSRRSSGHLRMRAFSSPA